MCHLGFERSASLPGSHDPRLRTLIGRGVRAIDGDVEVAKVLLVRNCTDSGHTGKGSQIRSYGLSL